MEISQGSIDKLYQVIKVQNSRIEELERLIGVIGDKRQNTIDYFKEKNVFKRVSELSVTTALSSSFSIPSSSKPTTPTTVIKSDNKNDSSERSKEQKHEARLEKCEKALLAQNASNVDFVNKHNIVCKDVAKCKSVMDDWKLAMASVREAMGETLPKFNGAVGLINEHCDKLVYHTKLINCVGKNIEKIHTDLEDVQMRLAPEAYTVKVANKVISCPSVKVNATIFRCMQDLAKFIIQDIREKSVLVNPQSLPSTMIPTPVALPMPPTTMMNTLKFSQSLPNTMRPPKIPPAMRLPVPQYKQPVVPVLRNNPMSPISVTAASKLMPPPSNFPAGPTLTMPPKQPIYNSPVSPNTLNQQQLQSLQIDPITPPHSGIVTSLGTVLPTLQQLKHPPPYPPNLVMSDSAGRLQKPQTISPHPISSSPNAMNTGSQSTSRGSSRAGSVTSLPPTSPNSTVLEKIFKPPP